jgi:hypothetical protein
LAVIASSSRHASAAFTTTTAASAMIGSPATRSGVVESATFKLPATTCAAIGSALIAARRWRSPDDMASPSRSSIAGAVPAAAGESSRWLGT